MFEELIQKTEGTPYSLLKTGKSLRMHNHKEPCSLAESEFKYLRDFIIKHNLKRGFEVATAFGVSTLSLSLGFKETGGKLVSMDAYLEEQVDNCMGYNVNTVATYKDSDGFKTAIHLTKLYETQDVVTLKVGFSPRDTASVVREVHGDAKLDFAFIDALHLDKAVLRDAEAVKPLLDERFAVFFHDTHCFSPATKNKLSKIFGSKFTLVEECKHPGPGFNLAYITNLGE